MIRLRSQGAVFFQKDIRLPDIDEDDGEMKQTPNDQETDRPQKHAFHKRSTTCLDIDGVIKEAEEDDDSSDESVKFDFDILLIVVTFILATVYYTSEFYASVTDSQYITMSYYLTIPIAPIGLAGFALVAWLKPPRRPRIALYAAILLVLCLLESVMTFEDCHLTTLVNHCCEYPWLPDINHEFEEPHETPSCSGLLNEQHQCAAYFYLTPSLDSDTGSSSIIPLSFSAVQDTNRGISIEGYFNTTGEFGVKFYSHVATNITDLLQFETCQTRIVTTYTDGALQDYDPGCYGEYLFKVSGEAAEICDPAKGYNCLFKISTLNCAFKTSQPLWFHVTNASDAGTMEKYNISGLRLADKPGRDAPDSAFYMFFRLVGMAALLECFFTLFGVYLKLVFISECRSEEAQAVASIHHDDHSSSQSSKASKTSPGGRSHRK
jgi:hypothetical protein